VSTRWRSDPGSGTILCLVGILSAALLAGCTTGAQSGLPSTTTTAAFTHSQVLGWVTPTMENGIAFVASISPSDTPTQMAALSRPLRAAALVSRQELAEVTWTGTVQRSEADLVATLVRLEALTAGAPGRGYVERLKADIGRAEVDLMELNRAVNR
jgi:hypothetical protein